MVGCPEISRRNCGVGVQAHKWGCVAKAQQACVCRRTADLDVTARACLGPASCPLRATSFGLSCELQELCNLPTGATLRPGPAWELAELRGPAGRPARLSRGTGLARRPRLSTPPQPLCAPRAHFLLVFCLSSFSLSPLLLHIFLFFLLLLLFRSLDTTGPLCTAPLGPRNRRGWGCCCAVRLPRAAGGERD